jgi:Ca2+-binding EF-hand superfamily protein
LKFSDIDLNKDGVLDKRELKTVLTDKELAKAVFLVADKNKDGHIDREEWNSALDTAQLKKQHTPLPEKRDAK